jgi:hypothetical protein
MYFLSVLKCELCSFTSNSYRGLTGHIVQKHGIAGKDYYDKYLKKYNEGICPVCGKPTMYISMHKGYLKHCSTSCSSLDPNVQNKLENTSKIKYGTRKPSQSDEVKEKTKQHFIEKYGVDNPAKNDIIKEKIKETCINRYGGIGWSSAKLLEKFQKTCLERYGAVNGQGGSGLEKTRQTTVEKYGVTCVTQSYEMRKKSIDKKRKNGSMSKNELYFESELNKLNIYYLREYKSDLYPYFCDFYIQKTNTFIELNNYWMHGGHWFDDTNEDDLKILNKWKEKSKVSSIYKTAINVWTKSDIEKRNCAIKNNLNYIVLWNKTDIDNFISTLRCK